MRQTRVLARELGVIGLINIQYAIYRDEVLYPRSQSPRVAHDSVRQQGDRRAPGQARRARDGGEEAGRARLHHANACPRHVAVKESVFPFGRFPGVDTILGPEMKSTGEVMGIDTSFAMAFAKAEIGRIDRFAAGGPVFISVRDDDKPLPRADRARSCRDGFRPGRDARYRAVIIRASVSTAPRVNKVPKAVRMWSTRCGWAGCDGHQYAGRRAAPRIHFRFGAPRWNCGCRSSPRWPARRPRSKESSR